MHPLYDLITVVFRLLDPEARDQACAAANSIPIMGTMVGVRLSHATSIGNPVQPELHYQIVAQAHCANWPFLSFRLVSIVSFTAQTSFAQRVCYLPVSAKFHQVYFCEPRTVRTCQHGCETAASPSPLYSLTGALVERVASSQEVELRFLVSCGFWLASQCSCQVLLEGAPDHFCRAPPE